MELEEHLYCGRQGDMRRAARADLMRVERRPGAGVHA